MGVGAGEERMDMLLVGLFNKKDNSATSPSYPAPNIRVNNSFRATRSSSWVFMLIESDREEPLLSTKLERRSERVLGSTELMELVDVWVVLEVLEV